MVLRCLPKLMVVRVKDAKWDTGLHASLGLSCDIDRQGLLLVEPKSYVFNAHVNVTVDVLY